MLYWCGLGKILNFSNLYLLRRIHRQTWAEELMSDFDRVLYLYGAIFFTVWCNMVAFDIWCVDYAQSVFPLRESRTKRAHNRAWKIACRVEMWPARVEALVQWLATLGAETTRTPHVSMRQANLAFARPLILKGLMPVWSVNTLVA